MVRLLLSFWNVYWFTYFLKEIIKEKFLNKFKDLEVALLAGFIFG